MDENQFLTPKDILGYAEEYIYIEEIQHLLNYSLSNSLDDIEIAAYTRTGKDFELKNALWVLNPNISVKVKHLMNKHHVIYSMTTWYEEEEKTRYLLVNMRVGDKWFITRQEEKIGHIYDHEQSQMFIKAIEILNDLNADEKDE